MNSPAKSQARSTARLAAEAAGSDELQVEETYTSAGDGGWSCATHVCWVDVDLAPWAGREIEVERLSFPSFAVSFLFTQPDQGTWTLTPPGITGTYSL